MTGPVTPRVPIDVGTYYRRRCEPAEVRLSLWSRNVRLNGQIVRWIEPWPLDLACDKEPKEYTIHLETCRSPYRTSEIVVSRAALLSVPATDLGLREVC